MKLIHCPKQGGFSMIENLNVNNIKKAIKTKILLWLLGISAPVILFLFILLIAALTPLFIFGGNNIYNYPTGSSSVPLSSQSSSWLGYDSSVNSRLKSPLDLKNWYIGSGFGMRMHPVYKTQKMHNGVDVACEIGTHVIAAGRGTVEFAGWSTGYGNLIILKHDGDLRTYYAHLSTLLVSVGETAEQGEFIALSGNTGVSTGPHLHFEVRTGNTPVNPVDYLPVKMAIPNVLPDELKYTNIDTGKLKAYLNKRNSLLADEPYFSTIIDTSEKYDLNVALMFAITGQEQSFVPKSSPNAYKIANNPYNVFHSWYEYNTNIGDSVNIACKTVINLSKGRPEGANPIAWINTRGGEGGYAEDTNWWIGVSKIFHEITTYTSIE